MYKSILIFMVGFTFVSCNKSKCSDGKLNGKETAIDCGGKCAPCETCNDGVKNQDEVNVDCGGSCTPCAIEYPETGTYGTNILTLQDTLYLVQAEYSLRAEVQEGSSLKVKLKSISGGTWAWQPSTNVGWAKGDLNGGEQDWEALNESCQIKLILSFMTGLFQVWYYENSESVTRVGYVYVN